MVVFAMRAVLVMLVRVFMMGVLVGVMVVFRDSRRIGVRMVVAGMRVAVHVIFLVLPVGHVNVEFHTGDGRFLAARNMQMITVQRQLSQLVLQLASIDSQINQRAEKHVAADSAEDIQV